MGWLSLLSSIQQLYNDNQRVLYDFWGPDAASMSLAETQLNVGLFYVLWAGILCVLYCSAISVCQFLIRLPYGSVAG